MKLLGASIGNCVHVAGLHRFLQLAEEEGHETVFLGPAVSVDRLFQNIWEWRPDQVALSYRLTAENVVSLLDEIREKKEELDYAPDWLFGGTGPVAAQARASGLFSFIADGREETGDLIRWLRGQGKEGTAASYGTTLLERLAETSPYPLLRHHFGLPSLEETVSGIEQLAEARVLDVISLGPDQNTQQFLFKPQARRAEYDGAGGVPIRSEADFRRLKAAAQRGNFPLLRCYSGTEDVFRYADTLLRTIDNAWPAIPLFWYSELDGRSQRPIEVSIRQAQALIRWHAERGLPVEVNDPHQWALRDAHDVLSVVTAYIAAYNAKKLGVRHYIAPYMFNLPHGVSFTMDYARVLAMLELVESLQNDSFTTLRQSRAGLPLFHPQPHVAKGQLAASTFLQMGIRPHLVHVVGFSEADHVASAEEVAESCRIVRGVLRHTLDQSFSIEKDERIVARKEELLAEARVFLAFVQDRYDHHPDPLTEADILADLVKKGYLDAVHILKGKKFKGDLCIAIRDGAAVAVDRQTGELLNEARRLAHLEQKNG